MHQVDQPYLNLSGNDETMHVYVLVLTLQWKSETIPPIATVI